MSARFFARQVVGQHIIAVDTPTYLGIWPGGTTTGRVASAVHLRGAKAFFLLIDAVYDTATGAKMAAATDYTIHLAAQCNTIVLADAQSSSGEITVNWLIP